MARSQYWGATVSGPKNPTLPQLAAKFDPARRPSSSAASPAPGSAFHRVRTMSVSPKNFSGSGIPRNVPKATRQILSASSRSSAASGRTRTPLVSDTLVSPIFEPNGPPSRF